MPPGSPSEEANDNWGQTFQGPKEFVRIVCQKADTNNFVGSLKFKRAHLLKKRYCRLDGLGEKPNTKNKSKTRNTY